MLRKGSPTPAGHRGSSSGQPILGTQSATTTTHMVLSKFYLLRYCFKLRLENEGLPINFIMLLTTLTHINNR